ncbi:MAG: hypothetical protein ACRCV3_05025 [Desulfovibrionaceae bacterium]
MLYRLISGILRSREIQCMIQYKENILEQKVICINTSIAKPIVSIIHPKDLSETITHLELSREQCTPTAILSNKTIAKDLESIYVIIPDHEQCQSIFPRWKNLLHENPHGLTVDNAYKELLTHNIIDMTPIVLIDYTSMILLSLAQENFYRERSKKKAILLCHAGEHKTAIISLHNNKIYSTFGFCSSLVEQDDFIQCLEELQDTLLKNDDVTLIGGCGSAFAKTAQPLSKKTELYIIGKRARKFTVPCTIIDNNQQDILIWNSIMSLYKNSILKKTK